MYLAYHLHLEKYVVIKKLRGNISNPALFRTEADILKNLHHHCLPQVYDYIQEQDQIYTVIDFVDGYDLDAYIKSRTPFPEPLLKRYLRQIADVLDYLHSQPTPVIHSDIKPGNIIIDQSGNPILIDFNTSIGANQGNLLGLTLAYASPEQLLLAQYNASFQPTDLTLDGRSDIYSLGATFYELISGIQPTPGAQPVPLQSMGLSEYSKDFLTLIDRMMVQDRDRRIQSAAKLVSAIDRMDGRYRAYFAKRCISLVLCGALIAGGAYCLIRGFGLEKQELFQKGYREAVALVSSGNLDVAEQRCREMIIGDDLHSYLADHPAELAKLYYILGNVYFYQSDYATAAAYYSNAADGCVAGSLEHCVYLRDAAIAYAQGGNLTTARALLAQVENTSASDQDIQLVKIVIDARSGNFEKCEAEARQLLQGCQDQQMCFRAALAVAMAAEDLDNRISWLNTAMEYDSGIMVRRLLAESYTRKAQQPNGSGRYDALREATKLYKQLCSEQYASTTDRINYSVVLQIDNKHEQARQVLEDALRDDPANCNILIALTTVCDTLGDEDDAKAYCSRAIAAWKADTSSDRLAETSDEICRLKEHARRFGIGGL